jgi:glycosyltransferase involved in cell wall biosynthesis
MLKRKKMNILLISDYFPPYTVGGAEISAYHLGVGLSKLGHEVSILTRYPKRIEVEFEAFNAVHCVEYNKSPLHDYLHTGILSSVNLAKRLLKLLNSEHFDIIHAQNWISGYAVARAKRKTKILPPSVLSIRDYRYTCPCLYGWCLSDNIKIKCNLLKTAKCVYEHSMASHVAKTFGLVPYVTLRYVACKMLAQSLNAFGAYITNSDFLRVVVLNNLGLGAEDVHTVYNAVNMEKFNLGADAGSGEKENSEIIKILYAGRFDSGKGLEYLIEAIPHVVKKHDNCSFVFVGDGATKQRAENLARKLNVSRHVVFEGFVPYDKISKYYQRCDIVVVPSVWQEPFGRSAIEAMACGKPVIATKAGGIPEVIADGKTGFIVEPANSKAIANAIAVLLGDEEMRLKMGEQGKKIADEKYNAETVAKRVLIVYENILNR